MLATQKKETTIPVKVAATVPTSAPITHLVYTGQDLNQYPNLVSISITFDQLWRGVDITSTKTLEIIVTGDARHVPGPGLLITQWLVIPNAKIDLSAVTNLLVVTVSRADTASVKLPNTVTHLTVDATTQITGASALALLQLTGSANTIPSWAIDGSLTTTNATLDLSAMTGLPSTLNLSTLNADITNLILPESVTAIQNLPTTVTHLTANVPALASIGAYNTSMPAEAKKTQQEKETLQEKNTFPTHITHVTLVDSNTTIINDFFFRNCTGLTSVDLSRLTAVTSIGGSFFEGCTGLISVNLSALTAVQTIGNWFFDGCTGLTSINLSGLTAVTSIGNSFFVGCTGLTSVNLSRLTAVTSIGGSFFEGCTGLISVNLSALTAVTSIGEAFFFGCTGLISVDLSRLTAVTSIGDTFFYKCSGLTSVNLSGFTAVTSISNFFFGGCTALTSVDLSGFTSVQTIGNWFFENFPVLVTITAKANTGANETLSAATVTAITTQIANKFTRLNLTGNAISLPTWVNDPALTATGATLDLSAMTNLPTALDLTGLSSDITKLIINTSVEPTNISNQLTTLKLIGDAPIPSWATNGSLTTTDATLDLSAMTGLPSTLDLTGLNSDITTVILSNGITPTNTTGWTNSGTTWTR